jgi:hypothetical protein
VSELDPTPEFWLLDREINAGKHGTIRLDFFDSAFEMVDSINKTICEMRQNGVSPTLDQLRALSNFWKAACKWLGRVPSEAECVEVMVQLTDQQAPFTSYRTRQTSVPSNRATKTKRYPKF